MHRTGTTVYATLRQCGLSSPDALDSIEKMRPVTHGELIKVEKGFNKALWAIAEDVTCNDLR
jgi:hypothetical protein